MSVHPFIRSSVPSICGVVLHSCRVGTKATTVAACACVRQVCSVLSHSTEAHGLVPALLDGESVASDSSSGANVGYVSLDPQCGLCIMTLPEMEVAHERADSLGLELVIASTSEEGRRRKGEVYQ